MCNTQFRDLLEVQENLASLDLMEIMVPVDLLAELVTKAPQVQMDYEEKVDVRVLQGYLVALVLMEILDLMGIVEMLAKRCIPIYTLSTWDLVL